MAPGASGWDWIGINFADGGALMAFRMRDRAGGGAVGGRDAARRRWPRAVRSRRSEVRFAPRRAWRSPRTGVDYPVAMTVRAGDVDVCARAAHRRSGARLAREHRHDLLGRRGTRVGVGRQARGAAIWSSRATARRCGCETATPEPSLSRTIRPSFHDVVAASASSSAFTPSSIVVRSFSWPREHREEMRHLVRVRGAVALEEEMLGQVAAHRRGRARDDFGRRVVAGLQHAVAAQHLEALVVAVRRAAARVDLAEPTALRADRHRGGVDVAGLGDRRIDEARRVRVHGLGLVVEDPAKDVEVVDQHVLEDAAGALDVRESAARRDRGSSRRAFRACRSRPSTIRVLSAANVGSKRRWKPIMQVTPARFDGLGAGARARDGRGRPAFRRRSACRRAAAARIRSACVSVDEQISTAPTSLSANTCAIVAAFAPMALGQRLRRLGVGVDDVLEARAGLVRELPAWIVPMRPAPKSATSIMAALASRRAGLRRSRTVVLCYRNSAADDPRRRPRPALSSMKNNTRFAAGRRFDIVCLGRFAVDFYAQQIGARLEDVASFAKYLGGSSANTAFGCARLGLKAAMAARVGDDAMGRFLVETLAREGCDVSHVSVDPTRLTARRRARDQGPRHVSADLLPRELRRHGGDRRRRRRGLPRAVEGAAHHRHALLDAARASREHASRSSGRARNDVRTVLDIDYRPVLWGLTKRGDGETRFIASDTVTAHLQAHPAVVRPRDRHRGGVRDRRRQHRHHRGADGGRAA